MRVVVQPVVVASPGSVEQTSLCEADGGPATTFILTQDETLASEFAAKDWFTRRQKN